MTMGSVSDTEFGDGGNSISVGSTKIMGDTWKQWDGTRWFDTGVPASSPSSSSPKYSGTGLPAGFVQGADGLIYVQDAGGLRVATPAEIAALNAPAPRAPAAPPVARFGFEVIGGKVYKTNDLAGTLEDTGIAAPGFSKVDVDRNGDLIGIDNNGQLQTIQRGFDYQKIDPRETAAEGTRQFNESQAGMDRRAALQESGAYDRNVMSEGESNRRAALNAQTQGFSTIAGQVAPLGRLALDNATFVRDTYSKPSDFLYASQLTRGVAPVNPMRTQADSINQLSSSIAGYNTALQGFNTTPVAGFNTSTAPVARPAPVPVQQTAAASIPRIYAPQTLNGDQSFDFVAPTGNPTREEANASLKAAGAPSWLPGFAGGTGMTTEPVFKVGEERDGSMNDTTEVIANPTNAPIGVISNDELGGSEVEDMEAEQHQKKAAAIGKVMQFVDNPDVLHALVDEMDEHKKRAKPAKKMPGFAGGTGYGFAAPTSLGNDLYSTLSEDRKRGGNAWLTHQYGTPGGQADFSSAFQSQNGFSPSQGIAGMGSSSGGFSFPSMPQIPGVASTTQDQLKADELLARPPAIASILRGERPKPLNLGFSMPTPGLLNSLTDREKEAFGTTLAVQYNLAPSDVEASIRQRFGGTGARSARF